MDKFRTICKGFFQIKNQEHVSRKALTLILIIAIASATVIYYHIDKVTDVSLHRYNMEAKIIKYRKSEHKNSEEKTSKTLEFFAESTPIHTATLSKASPRAERATADLKRVKDVCEKYKGTEYDEAPANVGHWHSSVDDEHKLIYYYIPKTGCTLWKAIFGILTNQSNETDAANITPYDIHFRMRYTNLYGLTPEERNRKLSSYFVFVVVRHPFERLVSGYMNKLGEPGEPYFQNTYGAPIIEKYRFGATPEEIKSGKPTFSEFINYLTDPEMVRTYNIDSHWAQYYKLSHPCFVRFDYIVRFEHMKEDTQHILELRNLTKLVKFTYKEPKTSNEKLKEYMQQLTINQIYKLYEAYKFDFELFGYDFDIRSYI
ncbi:carbohydrate sulfotransferase 11-like isoform X1 [Artemia franciscana]|uniref:carbohydrate sulfotransferase 11-like isoform X1 n=1 Tax=Artemia franciscana TaxID=6661 RepID=UPI0032DB1492